MDQIYKRQNEDDILVLLFAQKVEYDKAGIYNRISWGGTFILFVEGILEQIFSFGCWSLGISVVLTLVVFYYNGCKKKSICIGADTKNLIDSILFKFDYCDVRKKELFANAVHLKEKHKKKYVEQTTHTGIDQIRGVKDWYDQYGESNHSKVILMCQKDNLNWSEKLSNYYLKMVAILLMTSIVVAAFVIYTYGFKDIVLSIFLLTISTILIKFIESCQEYSLFKHAIISGNAQADLFINLSREPVVEELLIVQKQINQTRTSGFLIPDWMHKIKSKKLHKELQAVNRYIKK